MAERPLSANSGHSQVLTLVGLTIATHVLSVPCATAFDALAFVHIDNSQIRSGQQVAVCAMSLPCIACRRPDTPQDVLTARHGVEVRGPDARTQSAELSR